jgi:NTP pyrophosphatase (non-canonical NTP hydrolase)
MTIDNICPDLNLAAARPIIEGVETWIGLQERISALAGVTGIPTNKQVTEMAFALNGEVFELAQELGWKSWKDNPELDIKQVEKIAEEFADIMAFFGALTVLVQRRTGLTIENLVTAYLLKSYKNVQRFYGVSGEPGYSGRVAEEN